MTRPLLAEYAAAGWALVPIPVGLKGPVNKGWQKSRDACVTDPETAAELDGNIGLAHAYSGTCTIDVDDMETAEPWLAGHGIDLQTLIGAPDSVQISSGRPGRAKLLYRLPQPLRHVQPVAGLEFRCATRGGTSVQDVLPPSIHPDTKKPYEWVYGNPDLGHWSVLPELPEALLALWKSLVAGKVVVPGTTAVRSKNLGRARAMLFEHSPDVDYQDWIKIGMALHHETDGALDGLDLWDEWSKLGSKYKDRADLELHWRSFRADTDSPVTIASLRVDTVCSDDEFSVITDEQVAAANLPAPRQSELVQAALKALSRDSNGKPLAVLRNVVPILSDPDMCGQQLSHDEFQDILCCAPRGTRNWRPIRDTDYTATRLWLESEARFNPVSKEMVRDAIYYAAEGNKMDTAREWISSLQWDGVPRVTNFFPTYMGTIATPYEYAVGEYLWTALAGRVLDPGCQVDMVPILVGSQGIGKSRGVQAISPHEEWYGEFRLDEDDDKLARKMRGVLVGELAELRGLHTSELERIKAFITRTHEKWVPKFQEFATTFARRLVFIGTTNEQEFLSDEQNRRWLPIRCAQVDVDGIKRDRDQLWAEAAGMFIDKGVFWYQAQKLAVEEHTKYSLVDNWESIVEDWLSTHESPLLEVTINDVMSQAVGLDARYVTKTQEKRVGAVLRRLGYETTMRRRDGKIKRLWVKR